MATMQNCIDSDSDLSELDDETDDLVQDYLNDTRVESEQAKTKSLDASYTPEQLENIALYKNAIALNRDTEATYKKLEDSLVKMLVEVRRRLKENEVYLVRDGQRQANEGSSNYMRYGKPYFRDENNFPAPDNDDTVMMKQAQMYDFSHVIAVPGWTVKDRNDLITALFEFSMEIKKKEYRSQINRLRKENSNENFMEITRLEKEISQLHNKSLKDLALPLHQDYDWEDLANTLNRRHTAAEYKALWKLFFHPSINKGNWTKTEHNELEKIALENNLQDWDDIAVKLGTGRTGYQCFVYYRAKVMDSTVNRKWTAEETEYLLRVIDYFREGCYIPWGKVAAAMDGRTKIQVYNRYTRTMECRKGRFLEEEDIVLMSAYEKFRNDFKKISEYLPGRSAVQLKLRYNLLNRMRLSTTWTVEEDKKLLQIMANESTKHGFSNATAHFPGKDRTIIRSRYVTLIKWMKSNPTFDISMAPRRGARRLVHGSGTIDLRDAVKNLNKRIEQELNTKKRAKITIDSTEAEIENGIMALLINEIVKEEACKKDLIQRDDNDAHISCSSSSQSINNLYKLLVCLNASMNKTKFMQSEYASKYPSLSKIIPDENLMRFKCYSKVNAVETVERDDVPTIWRRQKNVMNANGILLPNYATLTGCRVLIKYCGSRQEVAPDTTNLGLICRRNRIWKEALYVLKERFITLFMWPILLSNHEPTQLNQPYVPVAPRTMKICLPNPTGPTIPSPKRFKVGKRSLSSEESDDGIDIPCRKKASLLEIQTEVPEVPFLVGVLSMDEDSLPDNSPLVAKRAV